MVVVTKLRAALHGIWAPPVSHGGRQLKLWGSGTFGDQKCVCVKS